MNIYLKNQFIYYSNVTPKFSHAQPYPLKNVTRKTF